MLEPFDDGLVRTLERGELLRALDVVVDGLLRESDEVPEAAVRVAPRLRELAAGT